MLGHVHVHMYMSMMYLQLFNISSISLPWRWLQELQEKNRDVAKAYDFVETEEEAKGFVTEAIDRAQYREEAKACRTSSEGV